MDLWDVAKVMWRRRGVTVPLLLLTAIAAVFALLTIPPGYSARAQIAFLAPPVAQPGQVANPFTAAGLAEYVSIALNSQEIRQQLGQSGLLSDYSVTFTSESLPLIGLEVVGKEQEEVAKTVDRLIQMVQTEAAKLQTAAGPGQAIAVSVADAGDDIRVVRSAGRRALVVIAGVGLLITAGVALSVDALTRRRSRAPEPPQRRLVPRQSVAPAHPVRRQEPAEPETAGAAAMPAGSRLSGSSVVRVATVRAAVASRAAGESAAAEGEAVVKEVERLEAAVTVPLDQVAVESQGDNDVTVVLPLAGMARTNGKQGKGPLGKRLSGDAADAATKR
ncbi:hypothetical protein Rhe02_82170 [Rhizocola hellebori]|uniref:Polysaccharide chain length determinant N-terminal domain-containing protein n=1 Tax=Rhizocola hellebori TaxID=1392758 RepID=A0A8J3VKV0_9ACTN|nr:hypothetical protein [Rhizocola hellebori]GIH10150.1 hypothetical protein Rhe02_82170 [Rhizocola hellebori]